MRSDDDYVLRIDSNVEISDSAGGTQVFIRGDFSIISHLLTHHSCGDHSLHPHLSSESPSDYANRRMSEVLLRFVRPRAANATTERNDDGGDADGRTASLMTQFCCRHFGRFERTAAAAKCVMCHRHRRESHLRMPHAA